MNKLRLILIMLRVFKGLALAGGLFAIVFFLVLPTGKMIEVGEPFWLVNSEEISSQIIPLLPRQDGIEYYDIQSRMKAPLDWSLKMLLIFFGVAVSGYFFILLHIAQQVVTNIRSGHPFTLENIKKIKSLGMLIALAMFGEKMLAVIGDMWFNSHYSIEGLELVSETRLGWHIVIVGAIVFALGVAFEQGLKLKEEQDLTI